MSGKPNPPQIAELREQLKILVDCEQRSSEIQKLIAEQRKFEQKAGMARRRVLELMEKMDLESSGNYGYEARTCWFLTELYRQIAAESSSRSRPPFEEGGKNGSL